MVIIRTNCELDQDLYFELGLSLHAKILSQASSTSGVGGPLNGERPSKLPSKRVLTGFWRSSSRTSRKSSAKVMS
jgi:hypothetical protein